MKVMIEMRIDIWPEVLERVKSLGFIVEAIPEPMCSATMLVPGTLPESAYEACKAVPGVLVIWEDMKFDTFDPTKE